MTAAAPEHERSRRRLELASTLLLALTTVATAWAGYQASRWHGEQAKSQAAGNAARVDAARLSGVANRKTQIDVAVFIQWVDAHAQSESDLASFYRQRFSERLEPAFTAWIATRPPGQSTPAGTPFELPQYVVSELREAQRLEVKAAASSEKAKSDIQHADNYVLCVVLLATALFFAGLSTRLRTLRSEAIILGLGCLLLVGTVIWMATFPTTIAV